MSSLSPETVSNNQNPGKPSSPRQPLWVTAKMEPEIVPDVGIVLVNWNVCEQLCANLRSLQESEGSFSARVIVVDNASVDGAVEKIRREFPWVTLVENDKNLGFPKACNQGIRMTQAKHVLLLNPDMRVEKDTLAKALAYAESDPTVGVFSIRLMHEDGTEVRSVRRFPTLLSQLCVVFKLAKFAPIIIGSYLGKDLDLTKEQEVDSVRGSFFFIHQRVLRALGGLDERYFIWFEEVDYCRRAKAYGFSVRHVPSIVAHDSIGQSFKQRRLFWKQQQMSRSMIRYFETWHPWWQPLLLRLAWLPILVNAWWVDHFVSRNKV